VNNLDNIIDRADNGNPTLLKFFRLRRDEDNPNIGLSDNNQDLLDKLKIPDFMEKDKSKSLTPHPNRFSTNYEKSTVDIPPVDIHRSQYHDFAKRTQPSPSTTSNRPNMHSPTNNFDKFNFNSLTAANCSASEKANSNKESEVSDHFHTSFGKLV
jgi:hypothetical protein